MNNYDRKRSSVPALRWIGVWATAWWGVSGLYLVLWVWLSRAAIGEGAWQRGLHDSFAESLMLQVLLGVIISGWIAGGVAWLRVLRAERVPYRVALRDLFLTVRK